MAKLKIGDKVRIKARADWPSPPGYRLANAEGTIIKWVEDDEVMEDFQDYIYIKLENAEGEGKVYVGMDMCFRAESLEKI